MKLLYKYILLFFSLFTLSFLHAGRCEIIERKIAENMKKLEEEVAAFQKMAREHKENVQQLLNADKMYKDSLQKKK